MFFQFWHPWSTQRYLFWVVNELWVCWLFMGLLGFRFCSFCFWNMSFFVFILDAIFCGTSFFIFQDTVWLVKSSWCVHCCSIQQFYCVSFRCRSEFALWWFLVRKKLSSQYWHFFFFFFLFRLENQRFLVFINLRDRAAFFGLIMDFLLVDVTWECLIIVFSFFSVESCLFMCLSTMWFFSLQVFPFLITASGWYYHLDVLILIHLFSSTGVVVITIANLNLSVFVSIKLSQIGSYH